MNIHVFYKDKPARVFRPGRYTWTHKATGRVVPVTATSRFMTRDGYRVHVLLDGETVGWNVPWTELNPTTEDSR